MNRIKIAENIQTLCATTHESGSDRVISREFICAVVDTILGPPPTKVMTLGGFFGNFVTKIYVYDIAKNEWTKSRHTFPDAGTSPFDGTKVAANADGIATITCGGALIYLDANSFQNRLYLTARSEGFHVNDGSPLIMMPDGSAILYKVHCDDRCAMAKYKHKYNKWTVACRSNKAYSTESAFCVALDNDNILVAGGTYGETASSKCSIYNVRTERFRVAGSMVRPRTSFSGCLLPNGEVFVSGGIPILEDIYPSILVVPGNNVSGPFQGECEIYTPSTRTWRLLGGSLYKRRHHACALISPTLVLVMAGIVGRGGVNELNKTCEVYDLETQTSVQVASMPAEVCKTCAIPISSKEGFLACFMEMVESQ
jgi:hypothetical protein